MIAIHPQFIIDSAGKKLVVLPQNAFDTLISELEDQEDIKLYTKIPSHANGKPYIDASCQSRNTKGNQKACR